MKKILVLLALLGGAYVFYSQFLTASNKPPGAFDVQGKPMVRLFVGPGCEGPCGALATELQNRKIVFEKIDVSTPAGEKLGVKRYPQLQIGNAIAQGSVIEILGLLAHHLGPQVLTADERQAFQPNFDMQGRARVVLFGTEWCAFCKKQRALFERNNIPYVEFDPEKSPAARTMYERLEGDGFPLSYVGFLRFDGYNDKEILQAAAAIR